MESHFSWIFVLIAGAVILAFFFSVVQKQQDVSRQKLAMTLAYDFEAVLGSAAVAKGASQPISLYGQEIKFSCSESCACGMSVGDIQRPFREKIIFSQSKINGKNMLLWTLDWKNPFRVANFLYATDDSTYYWFVNNTQNEIAPFLAKNFTKLAKFEFVNSINANSIKAKGFSKNRIIFINPILTPSLADLKNLPGTSALLITNGNLNSGDLTFYSLNSLAMAKTSAYAFPEYLLGAIFSEDPNMYDCGNKTAQMRFDVIKQTYINRTQLLQQQGLRTCGINYGTALSRLNEQPFNPGNLAGANYDLMLASCPTVY